MLALLLIIIVLIVFNIFYLKVTEKCEMRLLEFGENDRRWVTMNEYYKLLAQGKCIYPGFIDVTHLVNPDITFYNIVRERSMEYRMLRAAPKVLTQKSILSLLLPKIQPERMLNIIKTLSNYENRYCQSNNGVKASEYLYNYAKNITKDKTSVSVSYFKHKDFPQQSVIISVKGTEIPEEIVIYCAHLDSVNLKTFNALNKGRDKNLSDAEYQKLINLKCPGADDNASGVSNVLEAFTIFMENNVQVKRTVEFHLYAGEEIGLKGSTEIAEQYKLNNKKVVAVLNVDMSGYTENGIDAYVLNGKNDIVDAELTDLCKVLAPAYTKLKILDGGCGYSCTDNFAWTRFGFPACAVSEASPQKGKLNPGVHTEKDTIDNVNINYSAEHTKLGLSFIIETGMM